MTSPAKVKVGQRWRMLGNGGTSYEADVTHLSQESDGCGGLTWKAIMDNGAKMWLNNDWTPSDSQVWLLLWEVMY